METLCALKKEGHRSPQLAFDLIPIVARQLGDAWNRDEISFADVTIGCARLQHALHQLTDISENPVLSPEHRRLDCLVLLPAGAQHTLGATVITKQLRHAGIRIDQDLAATPNTLSTLAKTQVFDVIFISASLSETSDTLRRLVDASRLQWADSKIILGGTFEAYGPRAIATTKADYVTQDWQEALDFCI
ncbi:cobalamin B12-binding domain-containing protein [Rhodobacteraceae bacterium]|nr:cobalamin B12-binding domain-containing protein [Paracoccaceae bacterium]